LLAFEKKQAGDVAKPSSQHKAELERWNYRRRIWLAVFLLCGIFWVVLISIIIWVSRSSN